MGRRLLIDRIIRTDRRDHALMALILTTRRRRSEVVILDFEDYSSKTGPDRQRQTSWLAAHQDIQATAHYVFRSWKDQQRAVHPLKKHKEK
ncbi:MAG TPA: hypothetical protein VIF37_11375 [Methylobacter sp.]